MEASLYENAIKIQNAIFKYIKIAILRIESLKIMEFNYKEWGDSKNRLKPKIYFFLFLNASVEYSTYEASFYIVYSTYLYNLW